MEMTPEKWERVKELFEAALDQPSERRVQYLNDACTEDDLRAEVTRLLSNCGDSNSFLKEPAVPDLNLRSIAAEQGFMATGGILAGRFELLRFLARGGMGEVYEAQDQELHERVALKLVRPEFLLDSRALQKFKREVHLAKKVTHPNVCRTFDLFRHNNDQYHAHDLIFISMELLIGETLSQQIHRRGRLPTTEALPLIAQVVSGMAAAHSAGVIHRDFKPGNIILVRQDDGRFRAVITDFGLALRSSTDHNSASIDVPATQGLAVTPAYMAPEQIEGHEVTPAADIYALGLVMYEMLTGVLPFASETPFAMAMRRVREPVPSPRRIVPDLDPVWESVILKCLHHVPAKRFRTADEVLTTLTSPIQSIVESHRTAPKSLRREFISALVGIAVLGGTIGYYARISERRSQPKLSSASDSVVPQVKARSAVAVIGFHNLSGQRNKTWISESLTEGLDCELSEGGQLRTVSAESVSRMKNDLSLPDSESYGPETLRKIRQNVSADYVIEGSFLDLGDKTHGQIRVDARVQDARSGETIDSVVENGSESDLNGLLAKTGADLRSKLNVAPATLQQQTESRATMPATLEAAQYYAEGLEKLRAFDSLGARKSLEVAITKEPTFALAHAALSAAWGNLGYDDDARVQAQKALELAGNLPKENRLWIEAQFYEASRDETKAVQSFQELFQTYPDNVEYGLRLANAQMLIGKFDDAHSTLQRLRNLPPPVVDDPRIDLADANVARSQGDFQHSLTVAKIAEQKAEKSDARSIQALALLRESSSLNVLGNRQDAIALGEKARRLFSEAGDRDNFAKMNANLGADFAGEGKFADAQKLDEESLEEFQAIGDRRSEAIEFTMLATVAEYQDHLDNSLRLDQQALRIFRELDDKSRIPDTLGQIALILEYEGDLSDALAKKEEVLAIARENGQRQLESATLIDLAELSVTRGELSTARHMLTQADEILSQTGDTRGKALALQQWGDILKFEGNLTGARQRYEEALKIVAESNEKELLPYCQMSLADVEIDDHHASDAEELLKQVVETFHGQKNNGGEAWALGIYARAELESGSLSGALQKAQTAKTLSLNDHSLSGLDVHVIVARVEGLTGEQGAAQATLQGLLREAERQGNVPLAFHSRFALAEIALKSKNSSGNEILRVLANDAASKGFVLVAQQARSKLR